MREWLQYVTAERVGEAIVAALLFPIVIGVLAVIKVVIHGA
jgi:hypothetical protein